MRGSNFTAPCSGGIRHKMWLSDKAHCRAPRSLLTFHKMSTATFRPTVNALVTQLFKSSSEPKRREISPLLSVSARSAPPHKPLQVCASSEEPLLRLRVFGTVTGGARSAALRGGVTLCSGFPTGDRKGRGPARGSCDDRWGKYKRGSLLCVLIRNSYSSTFLLIFLLCVFFFNLFDLQIINWFVDRINHCRCHLIEC